MSRGSLGCTVLGELGCLGRVQGFRPLGLKGCKALGFRASEV